MVIGISVAADTFIITVDEVTTLTKNREDIYCCVSADDSTIVEIWETSPTESQRNLIFSSVYSNFNPPSGASASAVCTGINTILKTNQTIAALLADGTYGDIVVSSSGTVMTLLASINKTITGIWSFQYDKLWLYNAAATFYHKFRSLATATRTVTFPDFDGTVCLQNTMVITGGDQTTTANTAQNITELVTESLPANTRWRFRGFISPGCNNTGGVKFAVVIPTAATVQLGLIGRDSSATTTINAAISASATLSPAFNSVNAANGRLWIEGEVAIGANAGTVQFQFASTTAGQTSTIYQLGTGITYMQIT